MMSRDDKPEPAVIDARDLVSEVGEPFGWVVVSVDRPDASPVADEAEGCGRHVYWWEGEYEDNCELRDGHEGDHFDGLSWFNDENECVDHLHRAARQP